MLVAAAVLAAGITPVAVATATAATSASAPYCGITWGSVGKAHRATTAPVLTNVRAGRHACYDRLVFDVRGTPTGYHASYVATVHEDPSYRVVPLRGGAKLSITVNAPAYDSAGHSTYRYANRAELVNVHGYRTFRQVAWAGSFEGTTTIGLGVRARLPYRVFSLPGHLVIDVAHAW